MPCGAILSHDIKHDVMTMKELFFVDIRDLSGQKATIPAPK